MSSKTLLFETKTGEYSQSPQFMHHVALKLILQKSDDGTVSGTMHYVERSAGFYHDLEFTHFSKGHACVVAGEHLVTTARLYPLVVGKWLNAEAVKSVADSGGRRPVAAAPEMEMIVANDDDHPNVTSVFKDMQFAIAPEPPALWDNPDTCTLSFTQGGELQTNDLSFDLKLVDSIANDDDVFCNSPL